MSSMAIIDQLLSGVVGVGMGEGSSCVVFVISDLCVMLASIWISITLMV